MTQSLWVGGPPLEEGEKGEEEGSPEASYLL